MCLETVDQILTSSKDSKWYIPLSFSFLSRNITHLNIIREFEVTLKYIERMNELLEFIEKNFRDKNGSFDTTEMESFFKSNLVVCVMS